MDRSLQLIMLRIVEVKSFWQALILRNIRNECRQWMTHYSKNISVWDQFLWWFQKYTPRRESGRLYCYLFYLGDQAVGYGLASVKPDGVWISGGLREDKRGLGLGMELFSQLVDLWGTRRMFLDVFDTNIPGIKIYKRLGFRPIGTRHRKNVIIMRRSQKRIKDKVT